MVDRDGAGKATEAVDLATRQALTLYTVAGLAKVFISGAASASSSVKRKSARLMRKVPVKLLRPAVCPSFIATAVGQHVEEKRWGRNPG